MPHAEAAVDNGLIVVDTEYRDKDRIKLVPGARWDGRAKTWTFPLSWASCKALRGVFADDLTVGPSLVSWSSDEYANRVYPSLLLRGETGYVDHFDDRLREFQDPGTLWLVTTRAGLLGDDRPRGERPRPQAGGSAGGL